MITVSEALEKVLNTADHHREITVSLLESVGCILAEDIYTDRPMPPFDRVAMDGIAIDHQAFVEGVRVFPVEAIQAAGQPQSTLKDPKKCIEVMTGSSLPKGTDTVIRYEDLDDTDDGFKVMIEVEKDKNIHSMGGDYRKGEVILSRGTRIKAIDINILASVGKSAVRIYEMPKVAVISSGDELVEIDEEPADYQIRKSNVYMLLARLREMGIVGDTFHIADEKSEIRNKLKSVLEEYDVLLMSGGVSKGKYDFIPEILEELGVKKLFHGIAQRPGKPFWFGKKQEKCVFAFPGNPVSTFSCFHKYFIPWLDVKLGQETEIIYVELAEDISFKKPLHYLALAQLSMTNNGRLLAKSIRGNGSGDIASPSKADGFLELPKEKSIFKKGECYPFLPFHPIIK